MSKVKVTFDYDEIDHLTGLMFENKLSADSIQELFEDFKTEEIAFSDLIYYVKDALDEQDFGGDV